MVFHQLKQWLFSVLTRRTAYFLLEKAFADQNEVNKRLSAYIQENQVAFIPNPRILDWTEAEALKWKSVITSGTGVKVRLFLEMQSIQMHREGNRKKDANIQNEALAFDRLLNYFTYLANHGRKLSEAEVYEFTEDSDQFQKQLLEQHKQQEEQGPLPPFWNR